MRSAAANAGQPCFIEHTVHPDHWQLHADAVGSSASGHHLMLCQVWTLSRSSQQPEPCSWSSCCRLPYRDDTWTETCSDLYYCESGHRLGRAPVSNPWISILLWTELRSICASAAFFLLLCRVLPSTVQLVRRDLQGSIALAFRLVPTSCPRSEAGLMHMHWTWDEILLPIHRFSDHERTHPLLLHDTTFQPHLLPQLDESYDHGSVLFGELCGFLGAAYF